MEDLREIYQEVIFDHYQQPRNFHPLADANRIAEGFNPLCGDRLTVYLKLEGGVIKDASFIGSGCAISTASASLMTESMKGKTEQEANALFENFRNMLTGNKAIPDMGKLDALAGVQAFPARVKCATLAWHTLQAALTNKAEPVSTE